MAHPSAAEAAQLGRDDSQEAIDLARAGHHVAVATGTASGKSLCFQVPIAEAVTRLTDAERWAELSAAGQRQSQVFDWAKSADSLVELIRDVAAKRTTG